MDSLAGIRMYLSRDISSSLDLKPSNQVIYTAAAEDVLIHSTQLHDAAAICLGEGLS